MLGLSAATAVSINKRKKSLTQSGHPPDADCTRGAKRWGNRCFISSSAPLRLCVRILVIPKRPARLGFVHLFSPGGPAGGNVRRDLGLLARQIALFANVGCQVE